MKKSWTEKEQKFTINTGGYLNVFSCGKERLHNLLTQIHVLSSKESK